MVLNWWLLLLLLQVLCGVMGTIVKLNNGGFEDIVIAINPGVPEDNKIVDNIQDMIKEASTYLFSATKQRFYFKTAKVIIPLTWTQKDVYKGVTTETYDKADIIVADSFLKYGDDPYTLQYGGCGERGRYIHFTPNFLTNDSLHDIYGSRGRVFVHEWAHLRWGVFDEYNNNAPFYNTGPLKAEATRCSAGVTGQYIFPLSPGKNRKCKVERRTQLFESVCQFIPDKQQTTPASIMYMQSLSSVTQFCDESNHNIKATNMQNKLCNYRSTWEVIMNSTDFVSSPPINVPPPNPTISLLQTQDRALCLVLDVSGSMSSYDRIGRLKQAAEIFLLQIIEMGSWVGIVTFNEAATVQTYLRQITSDSERQTLAAYLPTTASGEGRSICSGVRSGFQVFKQKYQSTEGCEIVLLTDGEDGGIGSCFKEVESSGSIIHTIALGPSAAKELEALADMTGGLKFSATDNLDSNSLINAFTGMASGSGDFSQQSFQLESQGQSIGSLMALNGVVSIDKTVGNDTFFVVSWSVAIYPPMIILTDPKGKNYVNQDFVIDSTNRGTARLNIAGTAKTGDWVYTIKNTHSAAQVLSIVVTTRAASASVPPVTVKPYMNRDTNNYPNPMVIYAEVSQGFLPVVGAKVTATVEPETGTPVELELHDNGSGDWVYAITNTHSAAQVLSIVVTTRAASASVPPVTVKPYMNRDTNNYPNPMVIYAEVSQGFLPVVGVNVTATVEPETGTPVELELHDNGSGADIIKNDGIYSRYFTSFEVNGRYNIKVQVQGKDKTVRRVRRQNQTLYVPGYVENGVIKMNPPRPEVSEDEIQANLGNFSRVASGGSFVVAGVPPAGSPSDVFPPCRITDLEVELADDDDEFLLSWTAPGNDYDTGKAERYEIKMSENPLELRDTTFHTATSMNTSGLTTEVAGVKQSFRYKPENFAKENGTSIYFAIRAIDDSNNAGESSNIARAVELFSTLPSTPSTTHTTSSDAKPSVLNTVTIIMIIVCVSVIIICAIVSITICVLYKRRNKS